MVFALWYLILWQHEHGLPASAVNFLHALALWLLLALASWELSWALRHTISSTGAWAAIAWAILPAAFLAVLARATRALAWPLRAHPQAYLLWAGAGVACFLGLWSIATSVGIASPSDPLPYLPLLNPLDLVQAAVLIALVRFWLQLRTTLQLGSADERPVIGAVAVLGFIWLNAVLLRSLHQWTAIPYDLPTLMASTVVQTALSIFWAVLALTTMLVATRLRTRTVWLVGAALLVVVVAKLFLVDLASIGTIERIVSFVGVGLLMLVLGYFSPLPPAAPERA
jgi:uncharacterized membrane protein